MLNSSLVLLSWTVGLQVLAMTPRVDSTWSWIARLKPGMTITSARQVIAGSSPGLLCPAPPDASVRGIERASGYCAFSLIPRRDVPPVLVTLAHQRRGTDSLVVGIELSLMPFRADSLDDTAHWRLLLELAARYLSPLRCTSPTRCWRETGDWRLEATLTGLGPRAAMTIIPAARPPDR